MTHLPCLDIFDLESGEFMSAKGATNQQRDDDEVSFAFESGSIRHGEQLFGLFLGQPVAESCSLLLYIWDIRQVGCIFKTDDAQSPRFTNHLADPI